MLIRTTTRCFIYIHSPVVARRRTVPAMHSIRINSHQLYSAQRFTLPAADILSCSRLTSVYPVCTSFPCIAMPDTSNHNHDLSYHAARRQPTSADKPSSSATLLFEAHSLLLPLPRGLQPLLLEHLSGSTTITSPLNDTLLSVSLTLHVDASTSASAVEGEPISQSHSASSLLDWAAIVSQLHFITQHYPADSLSTLATVIAAYLCHSDQLTTSTPTMPSPVRQLALQLSLLPPSANEHDTTPAHPPPTHSLKVAQCDVPLPTHEKNGWGKVDVLMETSSPSAGLYLLHVDPHSSIPSHVHRVMCEAEMVLTAGLKCQGTAARWGAVHAWGEAVHGYTNDSNLPATVLCIDTPAFIPADEIVVTGQALATVEVQQAGQAVWQQLARSLLDAQADRPTLSLVFPGCYAGQSCRLSFDLSTFQPANAVLLFVLSPSSTSSSPRLLFVRHRVRGFELPGGKVESGESELHAAVRELREEAGVSVAERSLQPIAHYTLAEEGDAAAPHIKSVYVALLDEAPPLGSEHEWLETNRAEWREMPSWSAVLDDSRCSVLLRDNVYAICSRVADEMWRQTRHTASG